MFNENSVVVQSFVNLVKQGTYTKEQVPDISNLREQVYLLLTQEEGV